MTPSGLYRGHRGWVDARGRVFSGLEADEQVREAAVLISNAAQQQGYTGPAGLDAFLFRRPDPTNSETPDVLRPVTEFNARFTMGIVVLALVRAAIERIRERERLHPEHRLAFSFLSRSPREVGISPLTRAPREHTGFRFGELEMKLTPV